MTKKKTDGKIADPNPTMWDLTPLAVTLAAGDWGVVDVALQRANFFSSENRAAAARAREAIDHAIIHRVVKL